MIEYGFLLQAGSALERAFERSEFIIDDVPGSCKTVALGAFVLDRISVLKADLMDRGENQEAGAVEAIVVGVDKIPTPELLKKAAGRSSTESLQMLIKQVSSFAEMTGTDVTGSFMAVLTHLKGVVKAAKRRAKAEAAGLCWTKMDDRAQLQHAGPAGTTVVYNFVLQNRNKLILRAIRGARGGGGKFAVEYIV
jgi:hypothetical protein